MGKKGFIFLTYEYSEGKKNHKVTHRVQVSGPCSVLGSAIKQAEEFLNELKEIENGKD